MNKSDSINELLVATTNKGKMREIEALLVGSGLTLRSLSDFSIDDEVEETGSTFEENAILKAKGYGMRCGLLTLADDSGLEGDILDGEPGIHSARYGGPGKSDMDRNDLLLKNLRLFKDSQLPARFRCVVAVWQPGKDGPDQIHTFEGSVEGVIAREPRGDQGFGYDPLFYFPSYGKTLGQVSRAEKEKVSHRGQAVRQAVEYLKKSL